MSGLKKNVNFISVKLAKVFGPNFWGRFIDAAFTNISYKPIFLASGNSLCVSSHVCVCVCVCVCMHECARACVCARAREGVHARALYVSVQVCARECAYVCAYMRA